MAQVKRLPEEIATAVRFAPKLLVSVGEFWLVDVAPFPISPAPPSPQHETDLLSRRAQVCEYPEEIETAVRPVPRLLVSVGVFWLAVPPLPSFPLPPDPQQETAPFSRRAHV